MIIEKIHFIIKNHIIQNSIALNMNKINRNSEKLFHVLLFKMHKIGFIFFLENYQIKKISNEDEFLLLSTYRGVNKFVNFS